MDKYFEELKVGDRFTTGRRTVTEADVVAYAGVSGDYSDVHVDEVAAERSAFGARVAHGLLTLSIGIGLEFAHTGSRSTALAAYGFDRVRYVKPVFIGDTLHVTSEVIALTEKDERRGVVALKQEIVNQDGDPVVVLEKREVVKKRRYDAATADQG